MLESRDFVISPAIAYSPEQLHQFLLSELGANLLNNSQYRIEKISLDARNKNIKALVKIGLYSKDYNFASELESILPKLNTPPPDRRNSLPTKDLRTFWKRRQQIGAR